MLNSQRDRLLHMAVFNSAAFPDPSMHFFVSFTLLAEFHVSHWYELFKSCLEGGKELEVILLTPLAAKRSSKGLWQTQISCKSCTLWWGVVITGGSFFCVLVLWKFGVSMRSSGSFPWLSMVPFLPTILPTPNNLYQISSCLK